MFFGLSFIAHYDSFFLLSVSITHVCTCVSNDFLSLETQVHKWFNETGSRNSRNELCLVYFIVFRYMHMRIFISLSFSTNMYICLKICFIYSLCGVSLYNFLNHFFYICWGTCDCYILILQIILFFWYIFILQFIYIFQ